MNLSTDLTNVNLSEEETTTTRDAAIAKFQEALQGDPALMHTMYFMWAICA